MLLVLVFVFSVLLGVSRVDCLLSSLGYLSTLFIICFGVLRTNSLLLFVFNFLLGGFLYYFFDDLLFLLRCLFLLLLFLGFWSLSFWDYLRLTCFNLFYTFNFLFWDYLVFFVFLLSSVFFFMGLSVGGVFFYNFFVWYCAFFLLFPISDKEIWESSNCYDSKSSY